MDRHHLTTAPKVRPFTLIELLVVITIIAILASMLLPTLQKAKTRASTMQCIGTLKQTILATQMYGNDFEEYPDMFAPSAVNTDGHGNHPDFATGMVNRDGATSLANPATGTVSGLSYPLPRWQALLISVAKDDIKVLRCNAQRGTWTRNNSSTYNKPYMGFMNGDKTAAYVYYGPGVHWDDVNPHSVMSGYPLGVKWVSDAPFDSVTKYPKNWDLSIRKEKGVLFACPSRTMEGASYADYEQTQTPYAAYYNDDFNVVMPHGNQRERNYGFVDGHVENIVQRAIEAYTGYGIGTVWKNSPNGYY